MAEFTEYPKRAITEGDESMGAQITTVTVIGSPMWKLSIDGMANQKGSNIGIILISPERITIEKSLKLGFSVINNEAEYEAL